MTRVSATCARMNGTAPAAGLSDAMRMILGGSWDSSTLYTSLIQMKIHKHVFTGWGGCGVVELNVKVTVHYLCLGLEDLRVLLLSHRHRHPVLVLRLRLPLATHRPHDLGQSSPASWCSPLASFASHPRCSLMGELLHCLHGRVLLIREGHGYHWLPPSLSDALRGLILAVAVGLGRVAAFGGGPAFSGDARCFKNSSSGARRSSIIWPTLLIM